MSETLTRRRFLARLASGALTVGTVGGAGVLASLGTDADAVACVRPPGALPEDDFLALCIRCGRCGDACPNRCIAPFTDESGAEVSLSPGARQANTPVIFPRRQACMLCNNQEGEYLRCTEACPSGALQLTRRTPDAILSDVRMGVAEVDTNLCYSFNGASCGACVRACPFEGQALSAGMWEQPLVDPDTCVGCGLCERSCIRYPQAIRVRPSMEGR